MKIITITIIILCTSILLFAKENEYIKEIVIDESGRTLIGMIFPGQPTEDYRAPIVELPDPDNRDANVIPYVPAFDWSFGCSATAAAMIAGYYDRVGYDNMYTGPTNDGIMPLDNTCWPDTIINGQLRHQCPLSATCMGLDGRTTFGHVDDFWYSYGSSVDPYFGNWDQHVYGDCTADFMGTNQYQNWNRIDAATYFFFDLNGTPVYDYIDCEPLEKDGCHGFREFIESRGYNVQTNGNYSQTIYGYQGNMQGFSYDQFKAEIDAGRPAIIQIMGHSMVGFGYNDYDENLIYLHDTWDHEIHTMTWGGTYGTYNMEHFAVSVFKLEQPVNINTDLATVEKEILEQNYPNPFNPTTTISFKLNTENTMDSKLIIYNVKGQRVKQYQISNDQSLIVWDGTDDENQPVSSGIYFYTLDVGDFQQTRKMILLK
ncbi:MAG: T9SS type A sorting domain-containing protein [Armatimonadetes bacterium]|nr:T9SS type A sorting domain-containing protein [Armatimonadota bacterium]